MSPHQARTTAAAAAPVRSDEQYQAFRRRMRLSSLGLWRIPPAVMAARTLTSTPTLTPTLTSKREMLPQMPQQPRRKGVHQANPAVTFLGTYRDAVEQRARTWSTSTGRPRYTPATATATPTTSKPEILPFNPQPWPRGSVHQANSSALMTR